MYLFTYIYIYCFRVTLCTIRISRSISSTCYFNILSQRKNKRAGKITIAILFQSKDLLLFRNIFNLLRLERGVRGWGNYHSIQYLGFQPKSSFSRAFNVVPVILVSRNGCAAIPSINVSKLKSSIRRQAARAREMDRKSRDRFSVAR